MFNDTFLAKTVSENLLTEEFKKTRYCVVATVTIPPVFNIVLSNMKAPLAFKTSLSLGFLAGFLFLTQY